MITPRRTRLVRVADLQTFRHAIVALAQPGPGTATAEPKTIVVVPTRGAARLLMRTVDADIVTRDELYNRLGERLDGAPRRLTPLERDVMAQASAREAAIRVRDLSFQLRPGLVAEMLRLYDQLRRQSQQVKRFEELVDEALGSDDVDRATQRMRIQTRFLADAFRDFERRVRESGACDEHTLRERLIAEPAADPVRRIVVTVPDWIADASGLYQADFDLLTRIPGLESLDIVSTERVLVSGFHERLHTWWPGLEEISAEGLQQTSTAGLRPRATSDTDVAGSKPRATSDTDIARLKPCTTNDAERDRSSRSDVVQGFSPASKPVLVTQPGASPDEPWWTLRDREEELVAIVRQLKADRRRGESVALDRTAIVYKHPLPYLYAASEIFRDAGIPYQISDALPLAAEPTSAAFDLVLDAVSSRFSRGSLIALLRSPHFVFRSDVDVLERDGLQAVPFRTPDALTRESVSALDRALSAARYLGELERLEAIAGEWGTGASRPAMDAALAIARALAPLTETHPASEQVACLIAFWSAFAKPIADDDPFASRERRARSAIVDMLPSLAAVHASHRDPDWTVDELSMAVRRWIEDQTFVPDADDRGAVRLLDDQAARYGDFDDVAIVGVIDQDWPERPRRNIFYPPALLKVLGWPSEKDRRAAADARFLDLLLSARRRTTVATFTLDDDAIVSRSLQLDEIPRARLSAVDRKSVV